MPQPRCGCICGGCEKRIASNDDYSKRVCGRPSWHLPFHKVPHTLVDSKGTDNCDLEMDCKAFSSRTSFPSYIELLRNVTAGDFSRVEECRAEVCGALWGSGNPDVSGIGMAIGYLLESIICLVLLCSSLWLEMKPPQQPRLAKMLLANASRSFYDNAAFFTFAIQVASIATLTKADFGISADGMGQLTMEIVWLVSVLTLLPLLLLVHRPQMFQDDVNAITSGRTSDVEGITLEERAKLAGRIDAERKRIVDEARKDLRFLVFVICWAMAFCPFFSRMGGTFGESWP